MDAPHDRATERRQVTVLFCDVVDSTGLSERCDIEELREILLEFQAVSSQCISNSGGSVVNYIGDGIRAEFGYPLTSENEAVSAVRAGLVLLLYGLVISRALRVLVMSKDLFGSLIAAGVAAMLMFQVFVNVGMTIGIMPITGVTLPLMSYGGSSVITTLLAVGLLQSIYVQARASEALKGRVLRY